jgi:hypothetical protein
MHPEALVHRSEQHIFSTGLLDSGARLGLANMRYGLAKIHWAQEQLGLPADATFVTAPDLTVTRNTTRWASGFGYGGAITWGDGEHDLVFLDLKPNACGMIVGGLDSLPDKRDLLHRVHELTCEPIETDGVRISWDFGRSNHFIDLFEVEQLADVDFPPYAFMMHFAGGELRGETEHGPGLYWDRSPTWQALMQEVETPLGPLRVLTGQDARAYFDFFNHVDRFVRKRRRYAADRLFGSYQLINNETHQGMTHLNQVVLGCYRFTDLDLAYPIGLRPDLPAYLMRGRPNLSPETIENLGFEKRAQRLGVYDRLAGANLLPHGGGYVFPHILGIAGVHDVEGSRYYEVELTTGDGRQIISGVRDLPYEYRGRKVVLRTLELGMADLVARLTPAYVLKV